MRGTVPPLSDTSSWRGTELNTGITFSLPYAISYYFLSSLIAPSLASFHSSFPSLSVTSTLAPRSIALIVSCIFHLSSFLFSREVRTCNTVSS